MLGYNDLDSYLNGERFFGSNPGPFANRIKNASFTIDGHTYNLTPNEGANLLHSGSSAIEDNQGKTVASEGIDANYYDMLNYAAFCLIKFSEEKI